MNTFMMSRRFRATDYCYDMPTRSCSMSKHELFYVRDDGSTGSFMARTEMSTTSTERSGKSMVSMCRYDAQLFGEPIQESADFSGTRTMTRRMHSVSGSSICTGPKIALGKSGTQSNTVPWR